MQPRFQDKSAGWSGRHRSDEEELAPWEPSPPHPELVPDKYCDCGKLLLTIDDTCVYCPEEEDPDSNWREETRKQLEKEYAKQREAYGEITGETPLLGKRVSFLTTGKTGALFDPDRDDQLVHSPKRAYGTVIYEGPGLVRGYAVPIDDDELWADCSKEERTSLALHIDGTYAESRLKSWPPRSNTSFVETAPTQQQESPWSPGTILPHGSI